MTEQRILRLLSAPAGPPMLSPPRTDMDQPRQSKQELQLLETAAELGYCCLRIEKVVRELGLAMVRRMKPRTSTNVYQSATFSLIAFPLAIAEKLFPSSLSTSTRPTCKTWSMSTMSAVAQVLAPVFADLDAMVGGVSKALLTPSQRWSRVMATVISAEFTWVLPARGRVERLYVNFMYVLADEMGEVHPPKDARRRELAFSSSTMEQIRQRILTDAAIMAERGVPLSAGWFTQMGLTLKAMEVRALQANVAAMQIPQQLSPSSRAVSGGFGEGLIGRQRRKRKSQVDVFEVETIVEAETRMRTRGMWVMWAGYSPDWEAWRVEGRGDVGDPLVTWEPEYNLKHTVAYQVWKAQHEAKS